MLNLKDELKKIIDGDIEDDAETIAKFSRDASVFRVRPTEIISPKNSQDIKKIIKFVNEQPAGNLSITARSAGTDMSGGPLNQSIILNFLPYFNKIIKISDNYAITQPGVYYRDFEKETLKQGLLMPSYPASREICTVGGMTSNNSGGEKSLTYGKTENYVKKLKVVLSDGKEYEFSKIDKTLLEQKMKQNDFEGDIYRKMFELTDRNYQQIKEAKPNVTKNSAGYLLWKVWDKKYFDLSKIFVGAQGTLGMITEITYDLIHPKKYSKMLVIFLKNLDLLAEVINAVLKYKPESFESYDDNTLKLAVRYFPEIVKLLSTKNLVMLGWYFLPEFWMTISGGMPKLVLIAEFTGDSEGEATQKATLAKKDLSAFNLKMRLTKSVKEAQKYWIIRRESFNLLRHHLKDKRAAPFIDDIVVHPADLPKFLPELSDILKKYNLIYTIAGHVGDANFHIIPLMDMSRPDSEKIIFELSKQVYSLVLKYKGSITGEHNDGIIRSPFLEEMYGQDIYNLFQQVKNIFDPKNIFNPGKKTNATIEFAEEHLVKK